MSESAKLIIIADDHQMVIDGIRSMLANEIRYQVIAEANNGQAAYEQILAEPERFDMLLTDINMPMLSGSELCRKVKTTFPHIQVLVLSMYNNAAAVKEAVLAEADGYILKNLGKEELLLALHRISDGGTHFSQDIVPVIYNQYQKQKNEDESIQLSLREKEVLSLIVKEHTSEEIAEKLFISKKTVDNHRQNILSKTKSKSTVGLVKYAIRHGLAE